MYPNVNPVKDWEKKHLAVSVTNVAKKSEFVLDNISYLMVISGIN